MLSPGVSIQEINKSNVVAGSGTEIACYVGEFEMGPVNDPIFITNINEFVSIFGRGVDTFYNDFYQVYNFLQYSSGIWIVRSGGVDLENSSNEPTSTRLFFNDYNEFKAKYSSISSANPLFVSSRTPGSHGDDIEIGIISEAEYNANNLIGSTNIRPKTAFTFFEPGYLGIAVFKRGVLLETFYKTPEFLEEINVESSVIFVKLNVYNVLSDFIGAFKLRYGLVVSPSENDSIYSYSLFENPDEYDIDIIIGNEQYNASAISLAETRRDCIAFIGFPTAFIEYLRVSVSGNPVPQQLYTNTGIAMSTSAFVIPPKLNNAAFIIIDDYINSLQNSMFVHFTMDVKVQYDSYTDKNRLINIAGDVAGLKSSTRKIAAGIERGGIKNMISPYMKMNQEQKNRYYAMGANFTDGNVLMSEKTFITAPNGFNRVHVRSSVNHIEREVKKFLRYEIFVVATEENINSMKSTINNYLQANIDKYALLGANVNVHIINNTMNVDVLLSIKNASEHININMSNI